LPAPGGLAPELEKNGGPPISHPADPRNAHLQRERAKMDLILRSTRVGRDGQDPRSGEEELPMAAEPGTEYDTEPPEHDSDKPKPGPERSSDS